MDDSRMEPRGLWAEGSARSVARRATAGVCINDETVGAPENPYGRERYQKGDRRYHWVLHWDSNSPATKRKLELGASVREQHRPTRAACPRWVSRFLADFRRKTASKVYPFPYERVLMAITNTARLRPDHLQLGLLH